MGIEFMSPPASPPPLPAHIAAAALVRARSARAAPPEQPRLYADLLAEADRQRRAADDILVRGMIAVRDSRP